ncbi:MAG: DUF1292 domain-containing protein [Oscillospiraceae bacterium]|nr:DUF1292 domain-containing protein [Oscillospiraceae bacterium]
MGDKNAYVYAENIGVVSAGQSIGETFCEYINKLDDERQTFSNSKFSYDSKIVDFCGRSKEIERLISFCNRAERLLWWVIAGAGGAGKSRLAYEFGKALRENKLAEINDKWIAKSFHWTTFYRWFESTLNTGFGESDSSILIIIDYVHAYEKQIAEMITYIAQKIGSQNTKIRVLMIEREQQYRKPHSQQLVDPSWIRFFSDGFPNAHLLKSLRHEEQFLNLTSIGYVASVELIKDYAARNGKTLNESLIRILIKHASDINRNKNFQSPLYLLLVADSWINNNQDILHLGRDEVLSDFAKRETKRIRDCFTECVEEIKSVITILHVIATIIERAQSNQFTPLFELNILNKYVYMEPDIIRATIRALINKPYYPNGSVHAIQPDLIGECFVMDFIENEDDIKDIIAMFDLLMQIDRDAAVRFLLRFNVDFSAKIKQLGLKDYIDGILAEENRKNLFSGDTGKFTIRNAEGKHLECDVLFTFDSEETKKSYIIFTDNTLDENGNIKVYANTYDPSGMSEDLGVIETEKEWQMIDGLLSSLHEKLIEDNSDLDIDELEQMITDMSS